MSHRRLKIREYNERAKKRHEEQGICRECQNEPSAGSKYCDTHLEKRREARRKYREKFSPARSIHIPDEAELAARYLGKSRI